MSNHNDKNTLNSGEVSRDNPEPSLIYYSLKNPSKSEQTGDAIKYPQGYFKEKPCRNCGKKFTPNAPSELFCSDECKDVASASAYLKRNYNIDYRTYLSMLIEQNHKCKICGGEGFLMRKHHKTKLVVDHCHSTGKVRGLLCHNCNRALGLLQDNLETLKNAQLYLEGATTIRKE
jgi:predicted nucleic acid-binding Zn ribbon protein